MTRTYAGPIIERGIERGIVYSGEFMHPYPNYHLAVDSGSGELVILIAVSGSHYVSFYQPDMYFPVGHRYIDFAFTVTDDLSDCSL